MTIASELTKLNTNLTNSYTAVSDKGGTLPQAQNFDNLATAISSIPTGGGSVDHGGQYHILVVDYDGTILKEDHLNTGEVFTMPNVPTHDRLVFAEWSSSQELVNNTIVVADNDVIAGPIYDTVSGLNEFDVEVNAAAGMTVNLPMDGTKNWGDGTSDDTTSHTYTNAGEYTITCTGTKFTTYIAGIQSSQYNYTYKHIRLTNITQYVNYVFQYLINLETITLPKNSPQLTTRMFGGCYALKCCVLPKGSTYLSSELFMGDYALEYVVINSSIGAGFIYGKTFQNCYTLKYMILPKSVRFNSSNASDIFQYDYGLEEIGWTSDNIIGYPGYRYANYNLKRIVCTSNVASISGDTVLGGALNLKIIDFSKAEVVPTVQYAILSDWNKQLKIKVPAALYNDWIVATNWSRYANNIVAVDANGNEV